MFKFQKKKCTEKTVGTIVSIYSKGTDSPTFIAVEYCVKDQKYTIKESLKLKSKKIKVGKFTIGQKIGPKIGFNRVGKQINVFYDPTKPSNAYIEGNDGVVNC